MNPKPKKQTPAIPAPAFNEAIATPVEPFRHEPTGRTVAFLQVEAEAVHLFSATGNYIASRKARTAARAPELPAPAADTPAQ